MKKGNTVFKGKSMKAMAVLLVVIVAITVIVPLGAFAEDGAMCACSCEACVQAGEHVADGCSCGDTDCGPAAPSSCSHGNDPASCTEDECVLGYTPCAHGNDPASCTEDECVLGYTPCAHGNDPASCTEDECVLGYTPCAHGNDPASCTEDECVLGYTPCAHGNDPASCTEDECVPGYTPCAHGNDPASCTEDGCVPGYSPCEHDNDPTTCTEEECLCEEHGNNALACMLCAGFVRAPRGPLGVELVATIKGEDITGSSVQSVFPEIGDDMYIPMVVAASFSDDSTQRSICIEIKNGLRVSTAPGFDAASMTFSPDALPDALKSYVSSARFERTTGNINGYQPNSGKLIYEINGDATDILIEGINLIFERAFIAGTAPTFTNPISVTKTEDIGTSGAPDVQTKTATLPQLVCSTDYTPALFPTRAITRSEGESWEVLFKISSYSPTLNGYYSFWRLYKNIEISFTVPKSLGVSGVEADGVAGSSLTNGKLSFSRVDDLGAPTTHDRITITILNGNMENPLFNLVGTLASPLPDGEYMLLDGAGDYMGDTSDLTIKAVTENGTVTQNKQYRLNNQSSIYVNSQADNRLEINALGAAHIPPDQYDNQYGLLALGGFAIRNPNTGAVTDKRITFDFDIGATGYIGVQALTVPSGGSQLHNATVTTWGTNSQVINLGDVAVTGRTTVINMVGQLADGEYIKSFTYDVDELAKGAYYHYEGDETISRYGMNSVTTEYVFYWGKLLQDIGPGTEYISEVSVEDISTPLSPVPEVSRQQPITVNNDGKPQLLGYVNTEFLPYTSTVTAGGTVTLNMKQDAGIAITQLPTSTVLQNQRNAYKGVYIYLREPKSYVHMNLESFRLTYGSEVYSLRSDGAGGYVSNTKTGGVDDIIYTLMDRSATEGDIVHVLYMPNVIIGGFQEDLTLFPRPYFSVDVHVDANAPTKEIPLSEMILYRLDGGYSGDSATGLWRGVYDAHNVTGLGTSFILQAPHAFKEVLSILGNPEVLVTTEIDKTDNDWKVYTPGDDASVTNVSYGDTVRFRASVKNNTGEALPNGYALIVPVPKAGEDVKPAFGSGTWDMTLVVQDDITSVVNASSTTSTPYEVRYANSYEINKGAITWKDWNAVKANKEDIRAILIYSNSLSPLPDGFADTIYFPLAVVADDYGNEAPETINTFTARIWCEYGSGPSVAGYAQSAPGALRLRSNIKLVKAGNGEILINTNPAKPQAHGISYAGLTEAALVSYLSSASSPITVQQNAGNYTFSTNLETVRPAAGFEPGPGNAPRSYNLTVTVTDQLGKATASLVLKVVDDTAPSLAVQNLEFRQGSSVSAEDILNAAVRSMGDDYARQAQLEGTLALSGWSAANLNTVGEYRNIGVTVKDTVGNTTTERFNITVWQEVIDAHDITLYAQDVPGMTNNDYIRWAEAVARYYDGDPVAGEAVAVTGVDASAVQPVASSVGYDLVFSTARGTTITVKVFVLAPDYTVTYVYNIPNMPNDIETVTAGSPVPNRAAPHRDSYTFTGWEYAGRVYNLSEQSLIMPSRNITLYAQWSYNEPGTSVPDPEPTIVVPPAGGGGGATPTGTGPDAGMGDVEVVVPGNVGEATNPFERLAEALMDGRVPLGGFTSRGGWSLLNLMMSILALICAILSVIKIIFGRDKKVEHEEDEEPRYRERRMVWRALAAISGVVPIILFLIWESFTTMVFINRYTPYIGIAFLIHAVLLVLSIVRAYKPLDDDEDDAESLAY